MWVPGGKDPGDEDPGGEDTGGEETGGEDPGVAPSAFKGRLSAVGTSLTRSYSLKPPATPSVEAWGYTLNWFSIV